MANTLKSLVGDLVPTPEPQTPAVVETPKVDETPKETPKVVEDTATKETVAVQTQSVPLPVFMEVKHDLNDLRKENAELRSRFDQLQRPAAEATPAPVAKPDPLQVHIDKYKAAFIEENGHAPELSDIPVPANVYIERDAWQKELSEQENQRQEELVRSNAINIAETETMTDAAFGPGLGIAAMVAVGAKYLTKWDRAEIAESGANCPVVMYRKCMERAIQSGTPEGLDLANRVKARLQTEQKTGVTPESLATKIEPIDKQVETPPPSAEAAIGRHPHLARLGLKGYGRSA